MKNDEDKAVELVEQKGETAEQERRGISIGVENISVEFFGTQALIDISFKANAGDTIGVIGNSGSGKSTLCEVLIGGLKPNKGEVFINDIKSTKKSINWHARKGLRSTHKVPIYFEDLTLEENVIIGSPPSKGDGLVPALFLPRLFHNERRETARRILEYCNVDIQATEKMEVIPYSTKKMIELARALMGNPRVLILDEPGAGLNEQQRAQYSQVVSDYVETFNTTLIIVEHDIDMIRTLCKSILALDAGSLLASGEVVPVLRNESVKQHYLDTGDVI